MTLRYDDVLPDLRAFYDGAVKERDGKVRQQFKLDERAAFLDRLLVAEARSLLEIGAGTGQDSVFFAEAGLDVTAVDLSPEMVRKCQDKGLSAAVRDVKHLNFPDESFDAVFTLNCLLHVPNDDLPEALSAIRAVLRPGGLVFVGLWGGESAEGIRTEDAQEPKRFFSSRSDEELLGYLSRWFEVVDFHTIGSGGHHFQAATLVRPLLGNPDA
jgi:SAM-dependent methyltransferase